MPNKNHIPNLHHETSTEELLVQMINTQNPVTKSSLKQCIRSREQENPTLISDYISDEESNPHLWS